VPGWHEATREAQEAGRVQMLGIIQEQHPDRARLFMQWKQMDWPLLVDSFNLSGIKVVPITLFIDEWGIVRNNRPRPEDLEKFLATEFPQPDTLAQPTDPASDSPVLSGGAEHLEAGIEDFERALEVDPDEAVTHFRLGVAYRMRFDSDSRQAGDFGAAIDHWTRALELDPNQYIWRRRIQQYGPRLDKPYSFYDWVVEARRDIEARGETPIALAVEPGGAEFATPAKELELHEESAAEPDPDGRIERDANGASALINLETIIVPNTSKPGSYRVHLIFEPNMSRAAHWNNEAEPMQVWVSAPEGWRIDRSLHAIANAREAATLETRHVDFEVARLDGDAPPEAPIIRGHALYNVCEDVDGVCLYRRMDFEVATSE